MFNQGTWDDSYYLSCPVCAASQTYHVEVDTPQEQIDSVFKEFEEKHNHGMCSLSEQSKGKETPLTKSGILQSFALIASNHNVIVSKISPPAYDPMGLGHYYFTCKECKNCLTITDNLNYEDVSDTLSAFCKQHIHEPETVSGAWEGSLKPADTFVFNNKPYLVKPKEEVNYQAKFKEVFTTTKWEPNKIYHNDYTYYMVPDDLIETKNESVNVKAQITTVSTTITAVSAATLKWIAKNSDFNVDLQVIFNPTRYRFLCSKCQVEMALAYETVLAMERGQYLGENLEFLNIHKHEAVSKQLPEGRKFR